jgi:hypothetical protein
MTCYGSKIRNYNMIKGKVDELFFVLGLKSEQSPNKKRKLQN